MTISGEQPAEPDGLVRVSTTEFRANQRRYIAMVDFSSARVVINFHGRPVAVLVGMEDAEFLEEVDRRQDEVYDAALVAALKEEGFG